MLCQWPWEIWLWKIKATSWNGSFSHVQDEPDRNVKESQLPAWPRTQPLVKLQANSQLSSEMAGYFSNRLGSLSLGWAFSREGTSGIIPRSKNRSKIFLTAWMRHWYSVRIMLWFSLALQYGWWLEASRVQEIACKHLWWANAGNRPFLDSKWKKGNNARLGWTGKESGTSNANFYLEGTHLKKK